MICEYGFKHQSLRLNGDECDYVYSTLTSEGRHTNNPNHILVLFREEISAEIDKKTGSVNTKEIIKSYSITPTALYNYIDYIEIVEARKAANEAKQQASMAIQLSAYSLIIAVLLGLFGVFLTIIQIITN